MNPDNANSPYKIEGLEKLLNSNYSNTLTYDQLDTIIKALLLDEPITDIVESLEPSSDKEASDDLFNNLKELIESKKVSV